MAASAQAINVLQSLILTEGDQVVLTPTYHLFEMYEVHRNGTALAVELRAPRYAVGKGSLPTRRPRATREVSYTGYDPVADSRDGVHPNNGSGSTKMAGRWYDALAPLLGP